MNKSCFNQFPILESERLILREVNVNDVKEVYCIYGDPEVAEYELFEPFENEEKALKVIHRYKQEYEKQEEITWGITLKGNDQVIGYCCLGDFDEDAEKCEIGYGLRKNAWNKGIATEAVKLLTQFAFEHMELNRVEAQVTRGNDASIRVLKKANYVQEGILRERSKIKNKLVDDVMLAMLSKEYEEYKKDGC